MLYKDLQDVLQDEMFYRADIALRKGKHIGPDSLDLFEFLSEAQGHLEGFYARYDIQLLCGQEGYFYLLPDRNTSPAPMGLRSLRPLDMVVGQTLALLRLDPTWLATGGRIPDLRILDVLENLLGSERLLRYAKQRKRGRDNEMDARKLREELTRSLNTLKDLGFVLREGRGDSAVVLPLLPVMRFIDPVRTSEPLDKAIERLIVEGEIEELEEKSAETEAADGAEDADD